MTPKEELEEIMGTIAALRWRYANSPKFRIWIHDQPSVEDVVQSGKSRELVALELTINDLKRRAYLLEMELTP